ncbi:MAG: hypothetical protein OK454_03440 [Thaumarchaeota archaeon]|nr:hypothetical protein [Nitrososphaerota archaeon]
MVWPSLFDREAVMRPAFGSDEPSPDEADEGRPVVALRLPYNLPLQAYGRGEKPWVATASYDEPDWKGVVWRD